MSDSLEGLKRCPDCGILKPVTAFGRNASRADGLQFYCRTCFSTRSAKSYRQRQQRKGKTVRETPIVPDGMKFCPGCREIKWRTEWHRRTTSPDGLVVYCKSCSKARQRRDYLKRTFGLSEADLQKMIESQGGVCAICRQDKPEHIDHDHESGRVRGVLCGPCNMGLGLFKDDTSRLDYAIRYLVCSRLDATATVIEQPCCVIELNQGRLHAA